MSLDLSDLKRQVCEGDEAALAVLTDYRLETGALSVSDLRLSETEENTAHVVGMHNPIDFPNQSATVRRGLELKTLAWAKGGNWDELVLHLLSNGELPGWGERESLGYRGIQWVEDRTIDSQVVTGDFELQHRYDGSRVFTNHRTVRFKHVQPNTHMQATGVVFACNRKVLFIHELAFPALLAAGITMEFQPEALKVWM